MSKRICLGIPDEYGFMDEELIWLLKFGLYRGSGLTLYLTHGILVVNFNQVNAMEV
ncbi:hypothetical protein [Paenibacillus sp. BK720]|uniref:hypothetical protein n=1 Tax=Paenibacillus sp. BK720 TaxID=2587092 RepID=UPI001FBBA189|nr:hypothetical protein [Paenibacillus sp. BK720]